MGGFLVINPHARRWVQADELGRGGAPGHPDASPRAGRRSRGDRADGARGPARRRGRGRLPGAGRPDRNRARPALRRRPVRNHFARDLGLDRDDPFAALAAFDNTNEKGVDVGRANNRLFLNNVSLGIYARLVHRRELRRRRREAFARLRALGILLRRPGALGVTIDGRPVEARVVVVANNHYKLELFSLGARERLDEGLLHLYVAAGWLPTTWDKRTGGHFVVDADAGRMRAAVDGEPEELETPLRFEIEPGALRVLLPPGL